MAATRFSLCTHTLPHPPPPPGGAIDCVRKTLQWEGVAGLYKGVTSPLAGQMFFRATLFSAFGASKRWLGTNADGSTRPLSTADFYKAGFITGAAAAFTESPIDFYKSQIQVQMVRAKSDPNYKREWSQETWATLRGRWPDARFAQPCPSISASVSFAQRTVPTFHSCTGKA